MRGMGAYEITFSFDNSSSNTVTDIQLGDGTMTLPTSAKFDPNESAHWKNVGAETGVIYPKVETANTTYSAVLIPTTYAQNSKFLSFKIGTESFAYYLPAAVTFQYGKQYNYNITVKNRAITFTVSVTGWTDDNRSVDFK